VRAPDARFVALIKRAAFELRLAADIARAGDYELQMCALVEGARGNLRRVLRLAGTPAAEESEASGQESGVGQG
jgi:hypothetical protein